MATKKTTPKTKAAKAKPKPATTVKKTAKAASKKAPAVPPPERGVDYGSTPLPTSPAERRKLLSRIYARTFYARHRERVLEEQKKRVTKARQKINRRRRKTQAPDAPPKKYKFQIRDSLIYFTATTGFTVEELQIIAQAAAAEIASQKQK